MMDREDLIKAKEALEKVMKSFQPPQVINHNTDLEPIACFRSVIDWLDEETARTEPKFYVRGNYVYFGDGSEKQGDYGCYVHCKDFPLKYAGKTGAKLIADLLNKHREWGGE